MVHTGPVETTPFPPPRERAPDEERVHRFFDDMARALVTGDAAHVADLWEAPAFVIADDGVVAVTSRDEVERFFAPAKHVYNERGVHDTRADITCVEWVTNRICIVDVRWPWIDADGNEIGTESSTYTLRRDDDGNLRLRVALMRGSM